MYWDILSLAGWIVSGLLVLWLLIEVFIALKKQNNELLNDSVEMNEIDSE